MWATDKFAMSKVEYLSQKSIVTLWSAIVFDKMW